MPLFVCDECGCVENTALANFYWYRSGIPDIPDELRNKAMCSQCDPDIKKWHGKFPKEQYNPSKDQVINR